MPPLASERLHPTIFSIGASGTSPAASSPWVMRSTRSMPRQNSQTSGLPAVCATRSNPFSVR
jgi:hypothetical protein